MTPAETGRLGERLAATFLVAKGYQVMDANVRFEREEIDLVCFQPTTNAATGEVVVVEVKTRRGTGYGAPEAAVDAAKQKAILRVTEAYLHERRLMPCPVRFDVVAVTLGKGAPEIVHFENAFGYFV